MRATMWICAAAAGSVMGLAACGSSSSGSNAPSGEETRSADQIYADAVANFDSQPVVHTAQTVVDSTGTTKLENTATPNAGRATLTDAGGTVTVIVVVGEAAWGSQSGSPFEQLSSDLATQVSDITVHGTAACARAEHGGLTKGQISTVNGKRVIAIADDGKAPGASAGTLYVALDGTVLPVHAVESGASTAGGSLACGHNGQSTVTSQTIDFDYPSSPTTITPPAAVATSSASTSS